ncbi:MAG: hypothetical protein JNL01_03135 [Bdellovibrionales bacterium]|nr:hypothetical protein [Bdellovibrionales bacterium]
MLIPICFLACTGTATVRTVKTTTPTYAEQIEKLAAIVDWGTAAGSAYQNTGLSLPASADSGQSSVQGLKTFGINKPVGKELLLVTPLIDPANVWYGFDNGYSHYREYSDYDRFVDIRNGLGPSFESSPGTVSGWDGDIDQVYAFRLWHGIFNEAIGIDLKWMSDYRFEFTAQNGSKFYSSVIYPVFGTDYLLRVRHEGTQVKAWLNSDLIMDFTVSAPQTRAEFKIATNSHPLGHHFRFWGAKKGSFTDAEIAIIEETTQALWPRGSFPSFPYIRGISETHYTNFNSTTNVWTIPSGSNYRGIPIQFQGGSGTPGTHLYQWYYADLDSITADCGAAAQNYLDCHFPLVGATGPSVDRDDYAGVGGPFNGREGVGDFQVFCVVTPVDSTGTQGLPVILTPYFDNVP